jgi:hypothetical protein
MSTAEPTVLAALDDARHHLAAARAAAAARDPDQQRRCALSAIGAAAAALIAPGAAAVHVAAAHRVLADGLCLAGRRGQCGTEALDTDAETRALSVDDRRWLHTYLSTTAAPDGDAAAVYRPVKPFPAVVSWLRIAGGSAAR